MRTELREIRSYGKRIDAKSNGSYEKLRGVIFKNYYIIYKQLRILSFVYLSLQEHPAMLPE